MFQPDTTIGARLLPLGCTFLFAVLTFAVVATSQSIWGPVAVPV